MDPDLGPIVVLDRQHGNIVTPIRVYGARGLTGELLRTQPRRRPEAATLTAYMLFSLPEVIDMMQRAHLSIEARVAVLEFRGDHSHFSPWILPGPPWTIAGVTVLPATASVPFSMDSTLALPLVGGSNTHRQQYSSWEEEEEEAMEAMEEEAREEEEEEEEEGSD